MEIHQLRYVLAVAQTGNFSRAAERCHVSQPSLSQQILKLEEELGERLFDRQRQQSRLTRAGERFVQRAARVLDELKEASREAQDAHELVRGEVIVGALPTIAPYFLPPIIASFRRRFPGVSVTIQEETTAALRKLAAGYEIDLALASLPVGDDQMEMVELFTEELLMAVPPGHLLARKRSVTLADMEHQPFVLMKEGHCLGDQVLSFCSSRNFRPQVSSRTSQIETIQSLVRAGLGVSLIPFMAKKPGGSGAPVYRSLAAPRPTRTIVAFWAQRRPLDRAAAAFLAELSRRTSPRRPGRGKSLDIAK